MSFNFSNRSINNLHTAHPDLQRLFLEVIKHRDCTILCGHRTKEDQTEAFLAGRSKARWGESPHNEFPARAVDVMPYPVNWEDLHGIHEFAGFVQGVATQLGVRIRWGGHFTSFFDGPHYEME